MLLQFGLFQASKVYRRQKDSIVSKLFDVKKEPRLKQTDIERLVNYLALMLEYD